MTARGHWLQSREVHRSGAKALPPAVSVLKGLQCPHLLVTMGPDRRHLLKAFSAPASRLAALT
jgi:hypothetical protein